MEGFGVPLTKAMQFLNKSYEKDAVFDSVFFQGIYGKLVIAKTALVWLHKSSDNSDEENTQPNCARVNYVINFSQLEEEVLAVATNIRNGVENFGLRFKPSTLSEGIDFFFTSDDTESSRTRALACLEYYQRIKSNPLISSKLQNRGDDDDQKQKRRSKNRRKSLVFEDLIPMDNKEDKESRPTKIDKEAKAKGFSRGAIAELAREFVKQQNCEEIAEKITVTFGYEISSARTPAKEELEKSPPHGRQPTKKEVMKLKPIVLDMSNNARAEKDALQSATDMIILSPKTRRGAFQYLDSSTNQKMPVEEYAARYYKNVLKQSPKRQNVVDNPQQQDHLSICNCFRARIQEAESKLFTSFDSALQEFQDLKAAAVNEASDRLKNLSIAEDRITELLNVELNQIIGEIPQFEVSHAKPKTSKGKARRRSVCLEDVMSFVQHDVDLAEEKVIWSANQI